jgi:hypothetical protein
MVTTNHGTDFQRYYRKTIGHSWPGCEWALRCQYFAAYVLWHHLVQQDLTGVKDVIE